MRLLEFNRDEGGANPVPGKPGSLPETGLHASEPENITPPSPAKRIRSGKRPRVVALKSRTTPKARKPIDLEHLQQRVEVLEQRIKARTEMLGDEAAARDLVLLKQRMKLLERNINSELWAAKQREYTMLQMLAKPTLKTAIRQAWQKFCNTTLPALKMSGHESYRHWWRNSQPGWWQAFAAAWQESLDKARGHHRD